MTVKTTKLTSTRLDRMQIPPAFYVAALVFMLAGGISAIGRMRSDVINATQPTPALPIIIIASPLPNGPMPTAVPPVQVAAALPAPRYVVGFDSPNGRALGAIPAPEAGAIVARFGDEWLETTHDGAPIWIRASELGMNLANVAPAEPPQVVYQVVNAPAEAVPTPAAPVPTAPVVRATSAPVRPEDFVTVDPKAACVFVGCLR